MCNITPQKTNWQLGARGRHFVALALRMAPPGSRPAALGLPSPVSPGEGRRPGRRPWAKGRGAAAPRASSVVLCSLRVCGAVRGEGGEWRVGGGETGRAALWGASARPTPGGGGVGRKEQGRGQPLGKRGAFFGKRGAAFGALLSAGCVWRERDLGPLGWTLSLSPCSALWVAARLYQLGNENHPLAL